MFMMLKWYLFLHFNFKLFVASIRKYNWILYLYFISYNFYINPLIKFSRFCIFFRIFYIDNQIILNNDNITHFFSFWMLFTFFFDLSLFLEVPALCQIKIVGVGHPCFVVNLRGFHYKVWCKWSHAGYSLDSRCSFVFFIYWDFLIMVSCWIFLYTFFFASTNRILLLCLLRWNTLSGFHL